MNCPWLNTELNRKDCLNCGFLRISKGKNYCTYKPLPHEQSFKEQREEQEHKERQELEDRSWIELHQEEGDYASLSDY